VQRVAELSLVPGGRALARPLPLNWSITLRARFPARRSALQVSLGSSIVTVFDGSHIWHHVTLTRHGLVVDGRRSGASSLEASTVRFRALHGPVEVRALVIRRGAG
jgi:hypothetical protein